MIILRMRNWKKKLQQSEKTFQTWSRTSFEERARVVRKAAALLEERKEELARINTLETGKLMSASLWEVGVCEDMLNYYADYAAEFLKPVYVDNPIKIMGDAVGIYQPLGIIYMIEPWNVPFFQMTRPAAAQLMAGNVVVLKHASICPQCALAMEKIFRDAGAPEGVFTNLFVTYEQSDRLVADPRIKGITLTGSTEVGRGIAEKAGYAIKKCVMELGGSDAMVVLPDADLDKAINGRLMLSGQVCVADKRMFVHESLYDAFLKGVKTKIGELKLGDPLSLETTFGPLSSKKAADKVKEQIRRAVAAGAKAEEVGPKVPADSAYVQPTILTGVTPDNPLFGEEIFGPVLMVFSWSDEEETIRLANDTVYGLAASVYSEDPAHAAKVAAALEAGAVSLNSYTMFVSAAVPFGGVKESGLGRELGPEGIREFMNLKFMASSALDMKKVWDVFKA
ncbi:aldehyde dehydrogenase family protein [Acidaminococcus fermentans]